MAMRMSPKAAHTFNISPLTFILPKEYVNFLECFSDLEDKEGKLNYWIMKPAAKSRGRGKTLTFHSFKLLIISFRHKLDK
jgi:tubulin polyglutamylase TTLL5